MNGYRSTRTLIAASFLIGCFAVADVTGALAPKDPPTVQEPIVESHGPDHDRILFPETPSGLRPMIIVEKERTEELMDVLVHRGGKLLMLEGDPPEVDPTQSFERSEFRTLGSAPKEKRE